MASPTVLGRNPVNGGTAAASVVVAFDTTPSAGQLLWVRFEYGTLANTAVASSGWTTFACNDVSTTSPAVPHTTIFYRTADGTAADTLTISLTSARYSYIAVRISSGATVAQITTTSGNSGSPDCPANTPAGGAKDYLSLAGASVTNATAPTAAPTGYSNLTTATGSPGALAQGIADKALTAASSEDPSTFTTGSLSWSADTTLIAPASSTSYTLTAATGAVAVTGTATALKAGRKVTAAIGAFALTGTATALKAARKITAATGAFTLTGQAGGLFKGRTLTAATGAFALAGQAASFPLARKLTATPGAFAFTGVTITLTYSTNAPPEPAHFFVARGRGSMSAHLARSAQSPHGSRSAASPRRR